MLYYAGSLYYSLSVLRTSAAFFRRPANAVTLYYERKSDSVASNLIHRVAKETTMSRIKPTFATNDLGESGSFFSRMGKRFSN